MTAGCGPAPVPAPARPVMKEDPCTDRLDEITGALLMYYSLHKKLPANLDRLRTLDAKLPLDCPVCGRPYDYEPLGVPLPGIQGRAIIFDAQPCHQDLIGNKLLPTRRAVVLEPPRSGKPLKAGVTIIPEEDFRKAIGP